MDNLTQLFTLLSDPVRLRLLAFLSHGEDCVCRIHQALGLTQSTASRQLGILRTAGIVSVRRQGVWMHYKIAPDLWKPEWREILPVAIHAAQLRFEVASPFDKSTGDLSGQIPNCNEPLAANNCPNSINIEP